MNDEQSDRDELQRRNRLLRRSSRWRWVRRIIFVLTVNLLLFAGCRYQEWMATRRAGIAHRDALATELDTSDPNWRLADLTTLRNATLPPLEQNAAEIALKGVKLKPPAFDEWVKRETSRAAPDVPHLPEADAIDTARAVLVECGPALEVCRSVRFVPSGGFQRTFSEPNPLQTPMQDIQDLREAAALLNLDALVAAHDRRGDPALAAAHAAVATGRGVGDDPSFISQLARMAVVLRAVHMAERTLGWCECGDRSLSELQAAFTAEADAPRMLFGLRGDRAFWHRIMENMDSGTLWLQDVANDKSGHRPTIDERFGHWVLQMHLPEQQAKSLELFGEMLTLARTPPTPARDAEFESIAARIGSLPKLESMVLRLLLPAFNKIAAADTRTTALCRSTAVALACERFRLKHGRFPNTLGEIPRDILSEIPADPYTGKPLLYKKTDDGAVVYCTGADQTDDGGKLKPTSEKGFDIGFQLFDVAHRRKPPLPKTDQP